MLKCKTIFQYFSVQIQGFLFLQMPAWDLSRNRSKTVIGNKQKSKWITEIVHFEIKSYNSLLYSNALWHEVFIYTW